MSAKPTAPLAGSVLVDARMQSQQTAVMCIGVAAVTLLAAEGCRRTLALHGASAGDGTLVVLLVVAACVSAAWAGGAPQLEATSLGVAVSGSSILVPWSLVLRVSYAAAFPFVVGASPALTLRFRIGAAESSLSIVPARWVVEAVQHEADATTTLRHAVRGVSRPRESADRSAAARLGLAVFNWRVLLAAEVGLASFLVAVPVLLRATTYVGSVLAGAVVALAWIALLVRLGRETAIQVGDEWFAVATEAHGWIAAGASRTSGPLSIVLRRALPPRSRLAWIRRAAVERSQPSSGPYREGTADAAAHPGTSGWTPRFIILFD